MHEPDDATELEVVVAAALEALDRGGPEGLQAFLAGQGPRADQVRRIVGRVEALGVVAPGAAAALPERLGGHRILRELGRGGMGVVYEVADEALGRRLALKIVRPEQLAAPGARERFAREIAAAAKLSHPAIVPLVGAGEEAGLPFCVMPLLPGVSAAVAIERLADRDPAALRGADLRAALGPGAAADDPDGVFAGTHWQAAVRLVRQAALGIAHAHEHGIVHRDLKPSNLMLSPDGRALVVDFGLAQLRGASRLTRTGQEPGSPAYMAPEQLRGQPADERTDVYGLGVTLWHLATLRPPFPDADPHELQQCILAGRPTPPPRGALPPALQRVLLAAIDRDRENRYAGAAAFAADLGALLDGQPLAVPGLPRTVKLRRFAERHRAIAGASFVLVVLLPFVLGALWLREAAHADRLQAEKARADTALRDYDLLAGVVHADRAVAAAAELFPATPDRIPALRRWQEDTGHLLGMRGELDRVLASLAAAAATAPLDPARQFLRDTLRALQERLDALQARECVDVGLRLRWAEQVAELTFHHPHARVGWDEVRSALAAADGVRASTAYAGTGITLRDEDVLGLVPLGTNPVTKLLEFYDLRSAWDGVVDPRTLPIPAHRPDGALPVDEATGIVFVLLPGGRVQLGAQKADPQGPNFDPQAEADEAPHELTLAPFLLARHELTQAQWQRLWTWDTALRTPSTYPSGLAAFGRTITAAHPIENVDWTSADLLLRRHGMTLPTEAQWEYACRAGAPGPWPVPRDQLVRIANLADATPAEFGAQWQAEAWRDGFAVHAPVGSFLPNAFGLHDLIGNVYEWCLDEYGAPGAPHRAGDGANEHGDGSGARVVRGGSYSHVAKDARAAARGGAAPGMRLNDFGLRAARSLGR